LDLIGGIVLKRIWAGFCAVVVVSGLWSPVVARASSLGLGPVRSVKVTKVTFSSVSLRWVDPKAASFAGVVVREAKGKKAPKSPTSGTLVGTVKKPGRTITAKGLAASAAYSFAVFAYSKGSHYTKGVSVTARTSAKPVAPAITSADAATFSVGANGTFTVKASGFPAPAVTESGKLPSGVSFDSSAHALSGKPAAGTGGAYQVTFTAANGVGSPTVQHFTLSVDQGDAITSRAAATFSEGANSTFTVKATGFPAPVVTETGALPSGVSFDSSTGILSGKAAAGTTGTYPLTFTAGSSAAQHFTLSVSADPTCTDTWTGADSSDWDDPGNWSTSQVPGASDWACVPAGAGNEPVVVSDSENVSGFTDGGSLQVDGPLALWGTQQSAVSGTLTVDGTLTLQDAIAVTGTLDLNAGEVSGPGTVAIAGGAAWTVEGGEIDNGEVVNNGTTTVEANDTLMIQPGTTFLNEADLDLLADSVIDGNENYCPVSPELDNSGTLTVAATSTGTDNLGVNSYPFGCLTVTNSGAIDLSSGTLDVAEGTLNLDSGTSFSGSGTLETQQGTVSVNTPMSVSSLEDEGTIAGPSPLTVTGSLDSDGGLFEGPGTVTVASGAAWSIESTTINGGNVINNGSAELGANDQLLIEPGSQLSNTASFTMDADSAILGNANDCPVAPEFANSGTLTVAATKTGTDSFGINEYPYGCLTVANNGAIDLSSGTLDVVDGTLGLDSGTSFSGSGTLETQQGTVSVNTASSISSLEDQGSVAGSSPLTVTGSLDSDGGSFTGPGTVTVASGASWSIESTTIYGGNVINNGSAELGANDQLLIEPGSEFSNTASLTMEANSSIEGNANDCPVAPEFANSGTVTVAATSTGTDSFGDDEYPFGCLGVANTGVIDLSSGTLDVASDGTLNLDSGTSFSGPGTLETQDGTLAVDATVSVPVLEMDGGTVQGTGNLTVTSALTEGDGTFSGPGTVTIGDGASWEISQTSVTGGEVVSEGPATLDQDASLSISEGASVVNKSTMTFGANSSVSGECADQNAVASLDNAGTFDVAAGNGNTVAFSGNQSVNCLTVVNTAVLELSAGSLAVQWGSLLKLNSGTSVSGSGALEDVSGTVLASTSVTIPNLQLDSGILEIPSAVTVTASSFPSPQGTIQLDGTRNFGSLAAGGTASVGSLNVDFSDNSYSPVCGATVTVATAGVISGTFSDISGANLPSGAFWEAESTSTTASAVVSC
jgi:large repetitive protein